MFIFNRVTIKNSILKRQKHSHIMLQIEYEMLNRYSVTYSFIQMFNLSQFELWGIIFGISSNLRIDLNIVFQIR